MLKILTKFVPKNYIQHIQIYRRNYSKPLNAPVNEKLITEKLRQRFPNATCINVEDTSGGCGAMFNVSVESSEFKGLSVMKQHRIVYDTLKDEMTKLHGLHLETRVSN